MAILVVVLFCLLYTAAIVAQERSTSSLEKSNAPKTEINRLGFGKRVEVKLKNGSKASGRITGLAADQFVVTNSKGTAMSIEYTDVSRISKQKEKLGIFHRPWVGIMFTAAGVGTLIVLALQLFD